MTKVDWVLVLLFAAFTVDIVFTAWEFDDVEKVKRHPYYEGHTYKNGKRWEGEVATANFAHGFFNRLTTAMIFVCAALAIKYKLHPSILWLCCGLEVVDALDYWLTRNDEWFTVGNITILGRTYYDAEFQYNHARLITLFIFSIYIRGKKYQRTD